MRTYKLFLALIVLFLLPNTSNAVLTSKVKKSFSYISSQTTTGTLVGMVIDQQYNPIQGVLVKVINVTNGFSYGRRTAADGTYRIDFLPAGTYDITAQADGYQPNSLPQFLVEVNRAKIIKPPPIVLTPVIPPSTTSVTSTTNPIAVNPPQNIFLQANIADATLRGSATAEFLIALPLSGIRSFDSFALLIPGVLLPPQTVGTSGPGIGAGVGTAGQFSVNGERARNNNFTIDGSDNNDQDVGIRRQGFTSTIPQPINSITEVQITTLLADAEAGRNTGGQVNIVSRTGETAIHGDFYDFFTDSALNARDFFELKIPGGPQDSKNAFTRNQVGATFGLPIIKNKLAFFGAFEHQNVNRNQQLNFAVPSLIDRNQAFVNAQQFFQVSNLGRDVLALYPLPNNPGGPYGDNTFSQIVPANGEGTVFSLRVDDQLNLFGKTSTFTTRYNFTNDNTRIASVAGALNASLDAKVRTQNLAFTLNTEFSQLTSNQVRFSYGRTALSFGEVAGSPLVFQTSPLFPDVTGDGKPDGRSGPIGRLNLAPFSPIGVDTLTFPQGRANNTFQIADTLVTSLGKHTVKFGTDIRRVQFNSFLDRAYRAALTFTANPFSDLNKKVLSYRSGADFAALGVPSNFFQALAITPDSTIALRFTEANFFVHDNFALSKRVNISYGLRYEVNSVPKDATGRIENILKLDRNNLPFGFLRDDLKQTFLAAFDRQAMILGGRKEIYDSDLNNFAPRLGVALDLTGDGRTALRGGYGLFYDQILGNIVSQSRNLFPNFIPVNFGFPQLIDSTQLTNLITNPSFFTFSLPGQPSQLLVKPGTLNTLNAAPNQVGSILGALLGIRNGDTFGLSFSLPTKKFKTPYVHQYSLTLERTLADRYSISISYAGSSGQSLLRFRSFNGGQFTPLTQIKAGGVRSLFNSLPNRLRPIPGLSAIGIFDNSAESTYYSLQASLIRRTSNGFGFQLAYTYSHTIDDVSDLFDVSGSSIFAQDEIGRREGLKAERASANFDARHRFTAAWQYEIPNKYKLLQGFQLAGILTLQTGQPFTVNTSLDINLDGNRTDRLNTLQGLILSDSGKTRIKLSPNVSIFDLLARINLANPQNGAVGRNTFRAAGIASMDLSLEKKFNIKDSNLRLRLEAFNLFNRTHFAIPVQVLESPGFGSSVSTSLPARMLQVAIRYSF